MSCFVVRDVVAEVISEIFVADDVDFAYVLLDAEGTLDVERPRCPFSCCQVVLCKTVVSISLLRTLLNQLVVLIIVVAVVLQ